MEIRILLRFYYEALCFSDSVRARLAGTVGWLLYSDEWFIPKMTLALIY